jgi:hypothetical protein
MSYSNPSRQFQVGWQRSYWSRRDTRQKKKLAAARVTGTTMPWVFGELADTRYDRWLRARNLIKTNRRRKGSSPGVKCDGEQRHNSLWQQLPLLQAQRQRKPPSGAPHPAKIGPTSSSCPPIPRFNFSREAVEDRTQRFFLGSWV